MEEWVAVSFEGRVLGITDTKEQALDIIRKELYKMYENCDIDYNDLEDFLKRLETMDDACDMGVCLLEEWLQCN